MKLDIFYIFATKYTKWIIISLISLCSLLICVEWASLFFSSNSALILLDKDENPVSINEKDLFNTILNSSLFGVYVPKNLNGVKKSRLNVTLVGILFADNKDNSQVIIRSASGEEKTYKIGDLIPGDAVIKRITSKGVLVERKGALESLSFPLNDLTFEPEAKPLKED